MNKNGIDNQLSGQSDYKCSISDEGGIDESEDKSNEFPCSFSGCGTQSNVNTRQSIEMFKDDEQFCFSLAIPEIKIRQGRKHLNEKVIRSAIQCLADYKMSTRDLSDIIVCVAG